MSDAVSFDAQKHQSLERSFAQIFDAIDYSVSNGLHPPAFILVYSPMDIPSSLDTDEPRGGEGFKAWLDKDVERNHRYLPKTRGPSSESTY